MAKNVIGNCPDAILFQMSDPQNRLQTEKRRLDGERGKHNIIEKEDLIQFKM